MANQLVIGSGVARPVQMRRSRKNSFSDARQQRFLDMLAHTCNVRLAAEAAGVQVTTAYRKRRADPQFAERWREAIAQGYERLETELLERALRSLDAPHPEEGDDAVLIAADRAVADMDVRLIRIVLARYRGGHGQRAAGRAATRFVASEAETNAALLKQLAVLERQVRARS